MIAKKKKQRTPEQIKNRFYFAIGLIAFMIAVVFFSPNREKGTDEPQVDEVLVAMDNSIDTLVASRFGDGAEITFKGKYQLVDAAELKKEELELAEESLELLTSLTSMTDTMRIHNARERVRTIKEEADSLTADDNFYTRRVVVKTKEGKVFTAFQKIHTGMTWPQLVNVIENVITKEKQNEIEQTIREIEQ